MSSDTRARHDEIGWISFGAFLTIAAVIYLTTPNLTQEFKTFVSDFKLVEIVKNIMFFAPSQNHPVVYHAAERFCYYFGFVQIGILVLRIAKPSPVSGKARTLSDIVFWLGSGYILSLLSQQMLSWISFLGAFVVIVGVSIIVRALVLAFAPRGPA